MYKIFTISQTKSYKRGENMKMKILASLISVIMMSAVGAFTVIKVSRIKSASTQSVAAPKEQIYILSENNGNLAVFDEDKNLICEYEFNIYSLPDKDVEILKNGLTLHGFNELRSAIEDYTS